MRSASKRPGFGVEFDTWEIVGVVPGALATDHLPPNTHILHGVNPADILEGAGVVEVQYQP